MSLALRPGEDFERRAGGAGERRRQRRGEDERAGAIQQEIADSPARRDIRAGDPERLRQGRHAHIRGHAELGGEPGTVRTDHAGCMRFVDDQQRAGPGAERGELAQRRPVSVHGEHGVGDHDLAARRFAERLLHRGHICVRIDLDAGAGKAAAVDDRGVIQRVGEDQVFGASE